MKKILNNGIVLAFCTAILSGVSNVINKIAVTSITDPVVHTTVKNAIVGVLLLLLLVSNKKIQKIKHIKKHELIKLIAIAVIGGAIPFYLYFTALSKIPVINASLIHKSLIFWVALLAMPLLGEKLKPGHLIGLSIIFTANYVFGSFSGFSFGTYEWMALTATLLWAIEQIVAKKLLKSIDPDMVSGARMMGGSVILLLSLLFTGRIDQLVQLNLTQWGMITLTAVTLFLYVFTWYRALRLNSVITTAVILTSATVVSNLITGVFFTHTAPLIQFREGSMLVLGIFVYLYVSLRQNRQPTQ